MTGAEYRRMTERQLRNRRVRLRVSLANSWAELPTGTVCTIRRKYKGLEIVSEPCPKCGVKVTISRVPPQNVDLLPLEGEQG